MGEKDLLDLEYAALMHDIGQLSLTDPIPGGATVMAAPDEQRRIAELGAEVIRQTGVLGTVATIVERQVEPYRRPGSRDDHDVPLGSRIIRAANAYDDLVGGSLESTPRLSALERLRLGMTYDYDPRVVDALGRVLERSALPPA
jgi:response regulator RpfG family c-di-GMP phosphodiesterase